MKNQAPQQLQHVAATSFARSVSQHLSRDHNVSVSHAALRSSILKAQGSHPHALRKGSSCENPVVPPKPANGVLMVPRQFPDEMYNSLMSPRLFQACPKTLGILHDFGLDVLQESVSRVSYDAATNRVKPMVEMSNSTIDSLSPREYPCYIKGVDDEMRDFARAIQRKVHELVEEGAGPAVIVPTVLPTAEYPLYFVPDPANPWGEPSRLAFDSLGNYLVPVDWVFNEGRITEYSIQVPDGDKPAANMYSAQTALWNSLVIQGIQGLKLASRFRQVFSPQQSRQSVRYSLKVSMSSGYWQQFVVQSALANGTFDEVGEMISFTQKISLRELPVDKQAEQIQTYIDALTAQM